MLKIIRNFAVANVFAVFPMLWAVLGWMPDQVKVRMRGWEEAPGAIMANGSVLAGEDYGEWSGGRVFRFYLRTGMVWKDLVFRFPGVSGIGAVERIELQKWKLFALGKYGRGLSEREPGTAEYVFPDPRFDSLGLADRKLVWAWAMLELLLGVLSWRCARRHREEAWKQLLPAAIAVALALTVLTQVVLPIQLFLPNRSSYPFSFGALAGVVAWRYVWLSALGIVSVTMLARCFGRRVFGLVLALIACIYLEAVFLSNDLGDLNGDVFLLQNRQRALWDAMVWLMMPVAVLLMHPLMRKHYVRLSFSLVAMAVASLLVTLTTKHEQMADKSNLIVHDFVPIETVIRSVTYSTNRNVMVFILDCLEREQAHAIMEDPEAGPKLREQFRGFTEYTNNVGALPQTLVAVPNLLTGLYPDGTSSFSDYAWSGYGPESALQDFLEMDHNVFVTTPALGCGYTTCPNAPNAALEAKRSVLDLPGNGGGGWSVRNCTRWRWMPFGAKASVSALTSIAYHSDELREWGVFQELAKLAKPLGSAPTFLWIHTEGVHRPICWNRNGELLPSENGTDSGCIEQGVLVVQTLASLLDFYRQVGLYDNSMILVLGDHGYGGHLERQILQDRLEGRLPESARPCLWVKPVGSSHEFRACDLPTTHAQVSEVLRLAARRTLSEEDISSILQSDRRVYRRMAMLGNGWTDWVVDRGGAFVVEDHTTSLKAKDTVQPLLCGCRYSLAMQQMKNVKIDVAFANMIPDTYPRLPADRREASFEFRVPDSGKRYSLHLELFDTEGGSLRFRKDNPGAEWEVFPVRPRGGIVVHGVQADESGIARILFERAAGPDIDVAFTSILLEEEK